MMWLNNECADALDLFWKLAGEIEGYPRLLERPLALALPVALVKIPYLQLASIESWIARRSISFSFQCQTRLVRGCLVAYGGKGIIFVDGADPADQMRFTIAHEIAHFLLDYWLPRKKAIERMGKAITDVMDGFRSPTVEERVRGILGGIPIGIHTNLMERQDTGMGLSKTWKLENNADKLALALLAPMEEVLSRTGKLSGNYAQRRSVVEATLINDFRLPKQIAEVYTIPSPIRR